MNRWVGYFHIQKFIGLMLVVGIFLGMLAPDGMVALAQEEITPAESGEPSPTLTDTPTPQSTEQPTPQAEITLTATLETIETLELTPTEAETQLPIDGAMWADQVGWGMAEPGKYPWQVVLVKTGQNLYTGRFCGGAVLSPSHVVTAASCLEGIQTASAFEIVAGVHNLKKPVSGFQKRKVSMFYFHPDWDSHTKQHDIAVIRLAKPLVMPRFGLAAVDAIQLPTDDLGEITDETAWATGWGTLSSQTLAKPKYLQQIGLAVINDEDCDKEEFWGQHFYPGMFCASYLSGEGSCVRDAGGPLAVSLENEWWLVGVASWGEEPCGGGVRPSVFTRVGQYVDWIKEMMEYLPPVQPTLIEPKNNSLLNGYRVPLHWTEADGSKIQVEIWTDNPVKPRKVFNKIYTSAKICGNGECRVVVKQQLSRGDYSWRVRAQKSAAWGPWTMMERFSVVNPVPTLIHPLVEVFSNQPLFQWTDVLGMLSYQVQVYRGKTLVMNEYFDAKKCNVELCSFTPETTFLTEGAYKWRVRAYNGGRWNAYSAFQPFIFQASLSRVSLSSNGAQTNADSDRAVISADGRYVAFESKASNLVLNDTNNRVDIFVHDRLYKTTRRISVSSAGAQANGDSSLPSISADGRYIAFQSKASNLVNGDANEFTDIFVHDLRNGLTSRVSVSSNGEEGNMNSEHAAISPDGNFVAFASLATNLVDDDKNGRKDVFMRDLLGNSTVRISLNNQGSAGDADSDFPSISMEGAFVAFESLANNLVPNDLDQFTDVFIRDTQIGTTMLVSISTDGNKGNRNSKKPSISEDGSRIAFFSDATNLVSPDNNYYTDAFVRDINSNQTIRVSVATGGVEASGGPVSWASISADGRYVAFASNQKNLVAVGTNFWQHVFLHDLQTVTTTLISLSQDVKQANNDSYFPAVSRFGLHVVFSTEADNLVVNDINGKKDIFLFRAAQ